MTLRPSHLAALALAVIGTVASAQVPALRSAASVTDAVPNVSAVIDAGSATAITIRWNVSESLTGDPLPPGDVRPLDQFQVLARRPVAPGFVRERAPQLSVERVVVIAVDASGREVAWQHVADPRIVRAETPGPTLELSGQTLYRPVAELLVTLPDAIAAVAIRVYEVQWNGTEFVLREIGEVAVGAP